jgi:predicted Zn-dependent protease
MENFDKAYQQDSGNIDVLRAVVQGAIMAHELGQASDYLAKGMDADPQNPWLWYLKAQIAEARGNRGEAVQALRQARALNAAKTAGDAAAGTAAPAGAAPTPLTPSAAPPPDTPPAPANPFRRSQLTGPSHMQLAQLGEVSR